MDGATVVVISAEMARRHWPDQARAVGARLGLGAGTAEPQWMTIVGIVGDIQPPDFRRSPNPHVYVPLGRDTPRSTAFLLRANDTDAVAAEVRALVRTVDADLAVYELRSMQEAFADEVASSKVLIGMFSAFALVALALAAAGLYGVISYSVSQRTQEIGIRVAIGALPGDVVRLVTRQVTTLVSVGAALGLGGGLLLAQAMRSLLFGVSATDPATFGGVAVVLTIVAALASWLPARRAMRIDPVRALRAD
jgi:ABC-type antimicrobial peptide transport system permease subunit